MADPTDSLIRELVELTPASVAAARAIEIVVDDGTGTGDTAEMKKITVGALMDLLFEPPISSFTYASTVTFNGSLSRFYRVVMTGSMIIAVPTSGVDGKRIRLWLSASGADRAVTLNASIVIPGTITLSSPFTVLSGKKARLTLEYDATRAVWEVSEYQNGY